MKRYFFGWVLVSMFALMSSLLNGMKHTTERYNGCSIEAFSDKNIEVSKTTYEGGSYPWVSIVEYDRRKKEASDGKRYYYFNGKKEVVGEKAKQLFEALSNQNVNAKPIERGSSIAITHSLSLYFFENQPRVRITLLKNYRTGSYKVSADYDGQDYTFNQDALDFIVDRLLKKIESYKQYAFFNE